MQIFKILAMAFAITPGMLAAPISDDNTDLLRGPETNNTVVEGCNNVVGELVTLIEEGDPVTEDDRTYIQGDSTDYDTSVEEDNIPTEEDQPYINEERGKITQTTVKLCTDIERRGKCTKRTVRNYKCNNLYHTGGISSVEMYIASKCKFYKRTGCNDRFGVKQLEVDTVNGMWTWNMESYDMDNQVRSFMCFDYDA